jgi:hypothetical protein
MTVRAPDLVSLAVVVIILVERARYVVLMVVVGQDRPHVAESKTAVGIHVVIINVVDLVRDVVPMVHAQLARDVV